MVRRGRHDSGKTPAKQGESFSQNPPNEIGASTPFDFGARNLTPYGGLLPVATMLEQLRFRALIEETVTISRQTRVMEAYQFVLAMVLGL
jgi:hypothetical protein